jgi:hypothetical protein
MDACAIGSKTVTEDEVLKVTAGWKMDRISNIALGEGDDVEMWSVYEYDGERRARLMWPSARRQRLERPPMAWEVERRDRRGTRTETLLSEGPYGSLPESLPKAIKWLQNYLSQVPTRLRSKTRINFDTYTEYGETYPRIEISYTRPETDDEWAQRKAELDERIEYHTSKRRQEFERLQAEFAP